MLGQREYELLDFGDGRRLERFGPWVLDRPCPAVERVRPARPELWPEAHARFERTEAEAGQWLLRGDLPERWTIALGSLAFELKRTELGQVGLFPEQLENWQWLMQQTPHGAIGDRPHNMRVLNLFAYTGGSTLAATAAGAEVVHVDAARNIVAWARRNAELSGLSARPIHWVVEDALKFVKRELRRGSRYDAAILDPPSYGHGRRGEVWRLSKHLPRMLQLCGELTSGRRRFILLTCHTPGFEPQRLAEIMHAATAGSGHGRVTAGEMGIRAGDGRLLPAGAVVRWQAQET